MDELVENGRFIDVFEIWVFCKKALQAVGSKCSHRHGNQENQRGEKMRACLGDRHG